MTSLPLSGLRVLELGQLIAGPFATRILADFGADVIKIEPPETGDPLRNWRLLHNGTSVWWAAHARNKRSLSTISVWVSKPTPHMPPIYAT